MNAIYRMNPRAYAHRALAVLEPRGRAAVRRLHTIELLVFLSLLVPSFVLSLVVASAIRGPFTLVAAATILRDASLVALVLFFVWRNGEPLDRIGLGGARIGRDALLGVALYVPATAAAAGLEHVLRALGLPQSPHPPAALSPGPGAAMVLAVVLVAVVAVAEETIFRGYLLVRLREATGSGTVAVVLSSILFALGHGYEGAIGMVTVGFLGLLFALVAIWRGTLAAPMAMHFCQDLVAVVLLPALSRHR